MIKKDKALVNVGVAVVGGVFSSAGEDANPNAGLSPMSGGFFGCGVVGPELEIDAVRSAADVVGDDDTIAEFAAQLQAVLAGLHQGRRMADGGVVPGGGMGTRPAVVFEVPDFEFASRHAQVMNGEDVLSPAQTQGGGL